MSMFYSCMGELFSITVDDTEIPAALLLDLKKRSPSERDHFSSSASNRDRLPIIQDADERCPLHSTTSSSGEPTQTAISSGSRTAYDTAHPLRQRSGKRKNSLADDSINSVKEPALLLEANASGQYCSDDFQAVRDHRTGSATLEQHPMGFVVDAKASLGELLTMDSDCDTSLVSLSRVRCFGGCETSA